MPFDHIVLLACKAKSDFMQNSCDNESTPDHNSASESQTYVIQPSIAPLYFYCVIELKHHPPLNGQQYISNSGT